MTIAEQFRAKSKTIIKDEDAALRPLANKPDNKSADKLATIALAEKISDYQDILYAQKKHKLLIVLQGMDTSGKDGTVKGVFGQINPLGVRTVAFKAPSPLELQHDYLWRIHQQVPSKGEVVIFNRSHYEDVLITRVHNWIDEEECRRRYAQIAEFERMLAETGTTILKFFLHISKDEQKNRLEERLADPEKHWKFDPQDLAERKYWDQYQTVYTQAIHVTNTDYAPWYVVPANSKTHRNLVIANIVVEKLASMDIEYPPSNPEYKKIKIDD